MGRKQQKCVNGLDLDVLVEGFRESDRGNHGQHLLGIGLGLV